ncbi:hypothetical protein NSP_37090 [Nodularia spumigena CCY9414]|nr:hypothetical protein NSP_37090 [Nodularia spumigena CCY9414]
MSETRDVLSGADCDWGSCGEVFGKDSDEFDPVRDAQEMRLEAIIAVNGKIILAVCIG